MKKTVNVEKPTGAASALSAGLGFAFARQITQVGLKFFQGTRRFFWNFFTQPKLALKFYILLFQARIFLLQNGYLRSKCRIPDHRIVPSRSPLLLAHEVFRELAEDGKATDREVFAC